VPFQPSITKGKNMNASKERAREAQNNLQEAAKMLDTIIIADKARDDIKRKLFPVLVFVEAAERKLPTETSYTRAAAKKKSAAKPTTPADTPTAHKG
jgi:hypothetical protein